MARTTNEFGGGEIVPAIEAITGIQAPVMADFVAVPFGTVNHEHGERRQIQNLQNNLKSSSGIERIPFNGIDELDTEQGTSFANAFFQATFGSTAERTVIVNLTNGNGASGAVTLTFTPAGSGSGDYINAFNIAWNASTNARLSEYSATVGAFIDNSSISANIAAASRNISTLTIVDSGTSFTVTTSDFSLGIVVHALNTGDSRIRFVGNGWQQVSALGGKITTVIRTLTLNDYVEITFFGTDLNLLVFQDNTTGYDWRATVDGGTESGNLRPSNPSAVLQNNGQINIILPTASNLSPGIHTVRIRNASNGGGTDGFTIYGCEIVNENAGISQQPGADFDGRVELLSGTTFPIKPTNSSSIASVNSRTGVSEAFTGTTGARVLNYLTSGGQLKQSFDIADEAPGFVASTQTYTLALSAATSVTLPTSATSFMLSAYGAGGGGGGGRFDAAANSFFTFQNAQGGGGGAGGGLVQGTYTRDTSTQAETLSIARGVGGTAGSGGGNFGNGNNGANGEDTTVTFSSTTIATAPGGAGGNRAFSTGSGSAPGAAQTGPTGSAPIAFTGWTVGSTNTTIGGTGAAGGQQLLGTATPVATSGGTGGNVGGFGNTPLTGSEGQGGTASNGTGGNGTAPGAGAAGGGANTDGGNSGAGQAGGAGAVGRVYLLVTATIGLTNTSFGVTAGEFTANPAEGGDAGGASAKFGNAAFDTNRLNQEVIRRINFREFGANSAFATSPATASFTLDDGTTTLVSGNLAGGFGTLNGTDYMTFHRGGASDGDKSIIFTFVGTGLDLAWVQSSGGGTLPPLTVSIDGFSIGIIGDLPDAQENSWIIRPIVSGLAYGTHTVSIATPNYSTGGGTAFGPGDFIIYGPKKPEIPTLDAGSLELSDYNVMADFDATTSGALGRVSKGTLGKTSAREFLYTGSIGILATTPTVPFGTIVNLETNGSGDYTFYGTGIEYSWTSGNNNEVPQALATLDGNTLSTTNFSISLNGGTRAGTGPNVDIADVNCVFAPATGLVTRSAVVQLLRSILQVSVLELGVHTIRLTDNGVGSGSPQIEGAHVITPIHFQNDNLKVGSEGLNNLTIDPVVEEDEQVVLANLGEAKAWIDCMPTGSPRATHNISAVIRRGTGQFTIYFDKPFKSGDYVVIGTSSSSARTFAIEGVGNKRANSVNIVITRNDGANLDESFYAAFFGELIDE